MKTVSIQDLVQVVVLYCKVNGLSISPLKLQKILYYLQAWHIAKFDKEPLFEELPEAWVNGPVYRTVYDLFKNKYSRGEDISLNLKKDSDFEKLLDKKISSLELDNEQVKVINSVLKFYAPQKDGALVVKTHTDKPWNEAREGLGPFERSVRDISLESMYSFYSALLQK